MSLETADPLPSPARETPARETPAGEMPAAAPPRLMIPGPCQPRDEVLEAWRQPVQPHYGTLWARVHAQALELVRELTAAEWAYLLPGSGTLAIEAAICGAFRPGQSVVVPDTGYFGSRLVDMARAHGLRVRRLAVHPGEPVTTAQVMRRLTGADGVVMVHVETSTGVRHPVQDIARAVRQAGGLTVVDAVSSLAGESLALDDGGVDAVAAGTQKGLGCPPGLGIVALNDRAHARLRTDPRVPWYLDLRRWDRERRDSPAWEPHPVTMPTNLVLALVASLRQITATGVPQWLADRGAVAAHCRARFAALGLELVPSPGSEANLVVVARHPDPGRVRAAVLREAGIVVAGGLQPVPGAIRVGLMGAHGTTAMVDALCSALRSALR
jgi:alanine-glyoxylate transaminase/serine-glyoxylate transaminase/serine-pyruvate transaminase